MDKASTDWTLDKDANKFANAYYGHGCNLYISVKVTLKRYTSYFDPLGNIKQPCPFILSLCHAPV